jgi:hypothetical protein
VLKVHIMVGSKFYLLLFMLNVKIQVLGISGFRELVPYARQYNPRFVYFLPTF